MFDFELPFNHDLLLAEANFVATRSQGPGGQNVNKVSSRVVLIFNIADSKVLNNEQKELICHTLKTRINKKGELQVSCSTGRSQYMNKQKVSKRFIEIIAKALQIPEERIATLPTRSSVIERARSKSMLSEKKKLRRQKPEPEE